MIKTNFHTYTAVWKDDRDTLSVCRKGQASTGWNS